jgi:hypothetical protein
MPPNLRLEEETPSSDRMWSGSLGTVEVEQSANAAFLVRYPKGRRSQDTVRVIDLLVGLLGYVSNFVPRPTAGIPQNL